MKPSKKLIIGAVATAIAGAVGVRVVRKLRAEGFEDPLPRVGGWVAGLLTEAAVFALAVELGF